MPERVVRITVGSPSSMDARDDGRVTLRVEDALSGTVLVDLEMTPGRFWRLIQGTARTQMGFVSPNLDHVGKKSMHEEITVPKNITTGIYKQEDAEPLIEAWLVDNKPDYWDSYGITHHNYGWAVHGTWYVDLTPEQLQEYIDDRHLF